MKKKIIGFILGVVCLLTGCVSPHRTIGDEYIVQSVEISRNMYHTTYYVTAKPVREGVDGYTFNGQSMIYYTDTKYAVGDTIKIGKK